MLRVTHAICGTVLIVTAAILDTTGDEGGWRLLALAVGGVIVLLSSYRGEPDEGSAPL